MTMPEIWTDDHVAFWGRHRWRLGVVLVLLAAAVVLVMARTQWAHDIVYAGF